MDLRETLSEFSPCQMRSKSVCFIELANSLEIKDRVRKQGVPTPLRFAFWLAVSGASTKMLTPESHEKYRQLLILMKKAVSPATGPLRLCALFHLFSPDSPLSDTEILPLVSCFLRQHGATEEAAFWLLITLIDSILPKDFLVKSSLPVRIESQLFKAIMKDLLVKLNGHLSELGLMVDSFVLPWFSSLFLRILYGGSRRASFGWYFRRGNNNAVTNSSWHFRNKRSRFDEGFRGED